MNTASTLHIHPLHGPLFRGPPPWFPSVVFLHHPPPWFPSSVVPLRGPPLFFSVNHQVLRGWAGHRLKHHGGPSLGMWESLVWFPPNPQQGVLLIKHECHPAKATWSRVHSGEARGKGTQKTGGRKFRNGACQSSEVEERPRRGPEGMVRSWAFSSRSTSATEWV